MKIFYYYIDLCLPRRVALIPYQLAFKYLRLQLAPLPGVSVWYRNSCYRKNLVFGVSDIDISIMIKLDHLDEVRYIKNAISCSKNKYPFLGEVNFYVEEKISLYEPSLNYFERCRDPRLSLMFNSNLPDDMTVEKIVFLLRMVYSDRLNLLTIPRCRQKKWKIHFMDLGLSYNGEITHEVIINQIVTLLDVDVDVKKEVLSVLRLLFEKDFDESKIFQIISPICKFLFPNKYLWYENSEIECPDSIKNTMLEKICLRQIDWEIWGLMSQLPFIGKVDRGIEVHLKRLLNVSSEFKDLTGINIRILDLIEVSKNPYLQ